MASSGPARTRATSVKGPTSSARNTAHQEPGADSESCQETARLTPAPPTVGALDVARVYVWVHPIPEGACQLTHTSSFTSRATTPPSPPSEPAMFSATV